MTHTYDHNPSLWEQMKSLDMETITNFLMYSPGFHSVAVGVTSLVATSMLVNSAQQREADVFPVLYSDARRNVRSDERTEAVSFYAAVNDMAMAVTQSWNKAREEGDYKAFRDEWEFARGARYASEVEREGKSLLHKLGTHTELAKELRAASTLFRNSWRYRSHDNYRTEFYTTTSTDSDGNTTTTTHSRQVYDDTDHYFTFYPRKAQKAREKLEGILSRYPAESLYNPGLSKIKMEADSDDVEDIQRTVLEDMETVMSLEEAEKYLNQWNQKAGLRDVANHVLHFLGKMNQESEGWMDVIAGSQTRYHYNTTSRSHSGPKGYRLSKNLKNWCGNTSSHINTVLKSVNTSMSNAKKLKTLYQPNVLKMAKPIKPIERASRALDFGVESYIACFPKSIIDMDQRVSHGKTALIATASGVVVGVATYIFHPSSGVITY